MKVIDKHSSFLAALGACFLHAALLLMARLCPGAASNRLHDPAACAFLLLWIGWSSLEAAVVRHGGEFAERASRFDRLPAALTGSALLAMAWQGLWAKPSLNVGPAWLWFAVIGFSGGVALRVVAVRYLGCRFITAAYADPRTPVATGSVYRWVRHPSETGLLVVALCGAILLRSTAALTIWASVLIPLAVLRARREEQVLREVYGPTYEAYRCRTGMFLPQPYSPSFSMKLRRNHPANGDNSSSRKAYGAVDISGPAFVSISAISILARIVAGTRHYLEFAVFCAKSETTEFAVGLFSRLISNVVLIAKLFLN
jgi:protein-S-isoprenylcysteine O-methyltransferase Ste14